MEGINVKSCPVWVLGIKLGFTEKMLQELLTTEPLCLLLSKSLAEIKF